MQSNIGLEMSERKRGVTDKQLIEQALEEEYSRFYLSDYTTILSDINKNDVHVAKFDRSEDEMQKALSAKLVIFNLKKFKDVSQLEKDFIKELYTTKIYEVQTSQGKKQIVSNIKKIKLYTDYTDHEYFNFSNFILKNKK